MTDSQLIDKLLLEWSWRCEKGYPDPNNQKDRKVLEELLQLNLQEVHMFVEENKDEDFVLDQQTYKKDGEKVYVLKKDIEIEGDAKTQQIKSGATRYTRIYKGKAGATFKKLEDEKSSKGKDEENKQKTEGEHEKDVRQTLKGILGNEDQLIEATIKHPSFQSAESIDQFAEKRKEYLTDFKNLYKLKGEKGGRGELIPFVAIKGAKLGGGNKKDIVVGDQVLEVKELSSDINAGEFSTATSGNVAGSKFMQNFETFRKYLQPFEADYLYEEILRPLSTIPTNSISGQNFNYLEGLLQKFPISKDSLSIDFERIKFRGKYYAISKGGEASFKLDSSGNLIASTEQLEELDSKKVAQQNVLEHPWVKDPEEFTNNKKSLRKQAVTGVSYYLFYKKENENFIEVVKDPESDSRIQFSRITMNQVNLKFVHNGVKSEKK
jgi:hypothetical protein